MRNQEMKGRSVTILMYHYVRELRDSRYPQIKGLEREQFYGQLSYLEQHYNFVSVQQLISAVENGDALTPNAVLLTFNDCYADHFNNVFPVLDAKGIQGCFYPEIVPLNEPKVLLNHKIHFILAEAEKPASVVKAIFSKMDELRGNFYLDSNENYFDRLAKTSAYDSKETVFIKRLLQTGLPEKPRKILTDYLFDEFVAVDEKILHHELYLNKEQIRCMLSNGMHFGMLGYHHLRYDELAKEKQQAELKRARDFLADLGVSESELTAGYPWGSYNSDTLDILKRMHCRIAFTTEAAIADLDAYSPLQLPRLDTNEIPKMADAPVNHWFEKA